eukprot:PhM_4_TR13920/c0_g1_i1/m.70620/K04958/ITPR1; inositol 1,4,5-triphosphate receptor type 1
MENGDPIGDELFTPSVMYHDTVFLYVRDTSETHPDVDDEGYVCPIGLSSCNAGMDTTTHNLDASARHSWYRFVIAPMEDAAASKKQLNVNNPTGGASAFAAGVTSTTMTAAQQKQLLNQPLSQPQKLREVAYGDVVTLLHVETGTYLSESNSPSLFDPGNTQLEFKKSVPDRTCWFRIMPRFRVRVEGQRVQPNDEVSLESYDNKLWLHTSHETIDEDKFFFEVNLSATAARHGFGIQLYDPSGEERSVRNDMPQKRRLVAGETIRFFHKEEVGFVTVAGRVESEDITTLSTARRTHEHKLFVDPLEGGELQKHKGVHAECSFLVESGGKTLVGGVVTLDRPLRLKSTSTREYLCARPHGSTMSLVLTSDPLEPGTRFLLVGAGNEADNNTAKVYGLYRLQVEAFPGQWVATRPPLHALSGCPLTIEPAFNFRDAFELCATGHNNIVRFVANLPHCVTSYCDLWRESGTVTHVMEDRSLMEAFFRDIDLYIEAMSRACKFLDSTQPDPMEPSKPILSSTLALRKDTMVTLNIHMYMLAAIKAPFERELSIDQLSPPKGLTLSIVELKVRDACRISFQLLRRIIENKPAHARLLTPAIKFIAEFLAHNVDAQGTLLEILTDNEGLAMHMEEDHINHFFTAMRLRGREHEYVQFLRQVLLCRGKANRRLQDIVLRGLQSHQDLLFHTRLGSGGVVEVLLPTANVMSRPGSINSNTSTQQRVYPVCPDPNSPPNGWKWFSFTDFGVSRELRPLLLFHEACIELLAALCAESNQSAVVFVETVATPEIVLKVLESMGSTVLFTTKAAYTNLCRTWLVETDPPLTKNVKVLRSIGEKPAQGGLTPSMSRLPSVNRLNHESLIKNIRRATVEQLKANQTLNMTDTACNKYVLALIDLVRSFMVFNIGDGESDFVDALTDLLDSASDKYEGNKYALTNQNLYGNQIKAHICELFLLSVDKSIDIITTKLIQQGVQQGGVDYQASNSNKSLLAFSALEKVACPRLTGVKMDKITKTLMDMVLYHYEPLVCRATELLFKLHEIPWGIEDRLSEITLLCTDEEEAGYKQLCESHYELRFSLCSPNISAEEVTNLGRAIKDMTLLMTNKIASEREQKQALVEALGTAEVVMTFFHMRSSGSGGGSSSGRGAVPDHIASILGLCLEFLAAYVHKNPSHQLQCADLIQYLLRPIQNLDASLPCELLIELFADNRDMISKYVTEDIVVWTLNRCATTESNGFRVRASILLRAICQTDKCVVHTIAVDSILRVFAQRKELAKKVFVFLEGNFHDEFGSGVITRPVANYHNKAGGDDFALVPQRTADLLAQQLNHDAIDALLRTHDFEKRPSDSLLSYFYNLVGFFATCVHAGYSVPISASDCAQEYMNASKPHHYRTAFLALLREYLERQDSYEEITHGGYGLTPEVLLRRVKDDLSEGTNKVNDTATYIMHLTAIARTLSAKHPRPGSLQLWRETMDLLSRELRELLGVSEDTQGELHLPLAGSESDLFSTHSLSTLQIERLVVLVRGLGQVFSNNDLSAIAQKVLQEYVEPSNTKGEKEGSGKGKFVSFKTSARDDAHVKFDKLREYYNTHILVHFPPFQKLNNAIIQYIHDLSKVLVRNVLNDTLTAKLLSLLSLCIPNDDDDEENDDDDDAGEDDLDKPDSVNDVLEMKDVQNILDSNGVTSIVLLFSEHDNPHVRRNAVELGSSMLRGLNVRVQTSAVLYLYRSTLEGLMIRFRQVLQDAMVELRTRNSSLETQTEADTERIRSILANDVEPILGFMQNLCEGHNLALQNYLRVQADNVVSVDLVREVVFLTRALFRHIDEVTFSCASQGLDTLTELCQGPCVGNQEVLVEYNMASVVCDLLTNETLQSRLDQEMQDELLQKGIIMLLSMTEGINMQSKVPERLFNQAMFEQLIERMNKNWITGHIAHINRTNGRAWRDVKDGPPDFNVPNCDAEKDEFSDELTLGFSIFVFLVTVARYDKSKQLQELLRRQMSYKYFYEHTGQIEIARDGQLERVFYRIPKASAFLQEPTKEDVQIEVKRDTPAVKIQDFFGRWADLIQETEIYFNASKATSLRIFINKGKYLADASLILSIVISTFLMVQMHRKHSSTNEYMSDGAYTVFEAMSAFQVFMELWLYFGWIALRGRVLIGQYIAKQLGKLAQVRDKDNQKYGELLAKYDVYLKWYNSGTKQDLSRFNRAVHAGGILLRNSEFYVSTLFAAAAPMGLLVHPIFFSVQIFRVIQRSDSLQNVIKAVTLKWVDLLTTSALGAVVIFLFSMVSFYYFDDKYYDANANPDLGEGFVCQTLARCFALNVIYGLRQGGGIGDVLQHPNWQASTGTIASRLIFDFLFWLVMIIIFLNIIFGIILDTFADLRDRKQDRDKDKRTVCFICGIEAFEFDKYSGGFSNHYHEDHNMWRYLSFRHYLIRKRATDHTGQETYVNNLCDRKDVSFFPQEQAMCLIGLTETEAQEEEQRELRIEASVVRLLNAVETHNNAEKARRRKARLHEQAVAAAAANNKKKDGGGAHRRHQQHHSSASVSSGGSIAGINDMLYQVHTASDASHGDAAGIGATPHSSSATEIIEPELDLDLSASNSLDNASEVLNLDATRSLLNQGQRDQMLLDMVRMCEETSKSIDRVQRQQHQQHPR